MTSREIKFRAWHKGVGEMVRVTSLHFHDDGTMNVSLKPLTKVSVNDAMVRGNEVELMQYTGLKDKNGKEIYEGDVVGWVEHPQVREVVSFEGASFRITKVGTKDYIHLDEAAAFHGGECLEIIGNIYENPELLK